MNTECRFCGNVMLISTKKKYMKQCSIMNIKHRHKIIEAFKNIEFEDYNF